jgi:hypothetical protein
LSGHGSIHLLLESSHLLAGKMKGVKALVGRFEASGAFKPADQSSPVGNRESPASDAKVPGFRRLLGGTPQKKEQQEPHIPAGWHVHVEVEAGRDFPITNKNNSYCCVSLLGQGTTVESPEGAMLVDHNVSKLNSSEHFTKGVSPPRWNINPQMKTSTVRHSFEKVEWKDR